MKQVLIETCRRVKGGVVVFFPSYKYEAWFWQQAQHLNFERAVFREPQDSASVEKVLNSYAESIRRSKNGAVLFSVVGTVIVSYLKPQIHYHLAELGSS